MRGGGDRQDPAECREPRGPRTSLIPPHILTLDLGTSACRASLFTLTAEVAAQATARYPTLHPAPGWAEQDPHAWWDAVLAGVRRLPASLRATVQAVGLSSHRGGVVPMDGARRVLARCIIWTDRRSTAEVAALVRAFGRERLQQVTGSIPDTEFTASKILWLRAHAPEVFRAPVSTCNPGTTSTFG